MPDPALYPLVEEALKNGRTLPAMSMWGTVEDRLVNAFAQLSADLLAHPDSDLDKLLDEYVRPVVDRLNTILSGR
jgi:hypothetical protein